MSIAHTQLYICGVVLLYFTSLTLCGIIITGHQSLHAVLQKIHYMHIVSPNSHIYFWRGGSSE